jgi:hypothetical protein
MKRKKNLRLPYNSNYLKQELKHEKDTALHKTRFYRTGQLVT